MTIANLQRINEEVYVAQEPIVCIGPTEVAFVKSQAVGNARKRARICAHRCNQDSLHEMIIAIDRRSYIHPHKHLRKSESFHIVEGRVDVAVFDDAGAVVDVIALGDQASGRAFYYRLDDSRYHTLLIRSDILVVHEVTNGPFDRERTLLAPFAPLEDDAAAAATYLERVDDLAAAFLSARSAAHDDSRGTRA